MYTNLTISEFRKKLELVTKAGNPKQKFLYGFSFLFNDYSKPFYGLFDESRFSLTSNVSISQNPFIIRGDYKIVNNRVEIQFKVFPKFKYQKYWSIIWMLFGLITMIFIDIENYDKLEILTLIITNGSAILFFFLAVLYLNFGKKSLKNKFMKIFEISSQE